MNQRREKRKRWRETLWLVLLLLLDHDDDDDNDEQGGKDYHRCNDTASKRTGCRGGVREVQEKETLSAEAWVEEGGGGARQ